MWAAQAMPAEVDATADLAALGPRPPPVPQSAAGAALHMPSTIPEEPEDISFEPTSGGVATPRTAHGGSTARGGAARDRERDRDRSIAEIVLEESISLTEALANVEMTRVRSDASSLSQWLGDDGDGSSATLPLSDTLMPASLLGPGTLLPTPTSRTAPIPPLHLLRPAGSLDSLKLYTPLQEHTSMHAGLVHACRYRGRTYGHRSLLRTGAAVMPCGACIGPRM